MTTARLYENAIQVVPDQDAPLEDLCRPLSARVMPRSALLAADGSPLEPGRVMGTLARKRTVRSK